MKKYLIVTNDEYELPMFAECTGIKQVANVLGKSENTIRKYLSCGFPPKSKYKVVCTKSKLYKDNKECSKIYDMTHDRTEYFRNYYRKKIKNLS